MNKISLPYDESLTPADEGYVLMRNRDWELDDFTPGMSLFVNWCKTCNEKVDDPNAITQTNSDEPGYEQFDKHEGHWLIFRDNLD